MAGDVSPVAMFSSIASSEPSLLNFKKGRLIESLVLGGFFNKDLLDGIDEKTSICVKAGKWVTLIKSKIFCKFLNMEAFHFDIEK